MAGPGGNYNWSECLLQANFSDACVAGVANVTASALANDTNRTGSIVGTASEEADVFG